MTTKNPDIQPAVQHTVQVAIAGAGPVGLMMANYLGQMGIEVLVVEKLDTLIDIPEPLALTMKRCAPCSLWGWSSAFCRTPRRGTRCAFSRRKAAALLISSR